ncbi:MAG: ABC transporter permease, partial [Dethiobacteria bacterium]|nr:ABC transporter permease [Dethiobacteria bacterium]
MKNKDTIDTIEFKKKSRLNETWYRFRKNKLAVVGLIIFTMIMLCTMFVGFFIPYETSLQTNYENRLQAPSSEHLFGTDNFGRDILARILHASRYSLLMGIGAVAIGITVGGLLGSLAGFYGGRIDTIIMRTTDTILCI